MAQEKGVIELLEESVKALADGSGEPPELPVIGGGGGGGPRCWPCLFIAVGVTLVGVGFIWLNFYNH